MTVLVTGVAGFIGSSVARALLQRGDVVVGIDNINDYYDPALKRARLARLDEDFGDRFRFDQLDFANAGALDHWVAQSDWIEHLTGDPAIRSNTSVCLQFADRSDEEANKVRQKAIVKLLEAEDAAYDIGAYRDAPPGIRIWCGATVDTGDIEKLGPWLDWAWEATA